MGCQMTLLLFLACSEYAVAPCPEDTALPTFATSHDCPGYAVMWLPLVGEPLAVSWCSAAGECGPVEWSAGRWLYTTCPDVGTLRVLWLEVADG